MNSWEKAAAWVGAAASLVAVLAFFGITDLGSLQNAVGAGSDKGGSGSTTTSTQATDSALPEACNIAYAAVKALDRNLGVFDADTGWTDFAAGWTTYATQMEAAAVRTTDTPLQVYLREDKSQAEDLVRENETRTDTDPGTTSTGTAEIQAKHAWMDYCRQHGVRQPLL